MYGELRGQGTITYADGSYCSLALEAAAPAARNPELAVRASATLEECEFFFPNGDVYAGEFAQLDALDAAPAASIREMSDATCASAFLCPPLALRSVSFFFFSMSLPTKSATSKKEERKKSLSR